MSDPKAFEMRLPQYRIVYRRLAVRSDQCLDSGAPYLSSSALYHLLVLS